MSLRKATTAFDETIRVGGIGLALFFMLLELVYINAKSLYYLDGGEGTFSLVFAVIGSLAYSSTTIAVMRRPGHRRMKIALPVFDTLLVFCGYNLNLLEDMATGDVNPMKVALSIFIAVFTGVITYGLGMLNFEERSSEGEEGNAERIIGDLTRELSESTAAIADLTAKLNESIALESESKRIAVESKRSAAEMEALAERFLASHIRYEAWMGKKKSESNRNGHETAMNQLAERLKKGEAVSVSDFKAVMNGGIRM